MSLPLEGGLSILDLPDDCLLHITKFIHPQFIQTNFQHVCQRFKDIYFVLNPKASTVLLLDESKNHKNIQILIENKGHLIDTLCIEDNYEVKNLTNVIEKLPHISTVHWHNEEDSKKSHKYIMEDKHFAPLLKFQHLHTLELRKVRLEDNPQKMGEVFDVFGKKLKNLILDHTNLKDDMCWEFLKHSTNNIEKLDLVGNIELTLPFYEQLSQKCPNLTTLRIEAHLRYNEYEWLGNFPQLQNLMVYGLNNPIRGDKYLLVNDNLSGLLDSIVKHKAKQLQVLHLFCRDGVDDDVLCKISEFTQLKSLKITGSAGLKILDDCSVYSLEKLKNLVNLEYLALGDLILETDYYVDVYDLVLSLPKLKVLYVNNFTFDFVWKIEKMIKTLPIKKQFTVWLDVCDYDIFFEDLRMHEVRDFQSKSQFFNLKFTNGAVSTDGWSRSQRIYKYNDICEDNYDYYCDDNYDYVEKMDDVLGI